MLDVTFEQEGFDQLKDAFEDLPDAFQEGVLAAAQTLRDLTRGRTPFDTGDLKESWSDIEHEDGGLSFGTDVDYSEILEHGLYPKVGPRTIAKVMPWKMGIYSRQAPGGILRPLAEDKDVIRDVEELIVDEIEKGLESAGT